MVQLVAHRSRVGDDPENTVLGLGGIPPWVDAVEIDVRRAADGTCVLMHDRTLDRTTDVAGPVNERSWRELKDIEVTGGGSIPRLSRFLRHAERTWLDVLIDVKDDSMAAARAVVEGPLSSPMARRCLLLFRTPEQLRWVRGQYPDARLGILRIREFTVDKWASLAPEIGAEVAFIAPGDTAYLENRAAVLALLERGVAVGASLVNDLDVIDTATRDGCSMILTDRSLELLQWKRGVVGRADQATPPPRHGTRATSTGDSVHTHKDARQERD